MRDLFTNVEISENGLQIQIPLYCIDREPVSKIYLADFKFGVEGIETLDFLIVEAQKSNDKFAITKKKQIKILTERAWTGTYVEASKYEIFVYRVRSPLLGCFFL